MAVAELAVEPAVDQATMANPTMAAHASATTQAAAAMPARTTLPLACGAAGGVRSRVRVAEVIGSRVRDRKACVGDIARCVGTSVEESHATTTDGELT